MANVHELGTVEYFVVTLALDIGTDKAAHPIIGNYDRWKNLELAEGLKSDQSIEDQLLCDIECTLTIIRLRE